jgi:hypothetical protein
MQVRGSIAASISACHAEDPGSIPGRGVLANNPIRCSSHSRILLQGLDHSKWRDTETYPNHLQFYHVFWIPGNVALISMQLISVRQ